MMPYDSTTPQPKGVSNYQVILPLLLICILFANALRSSPGPDILLSFAHADKVIHVLMYGFLATLFCRLRAFSRPIYGPLTVVLIVGAIGAADEFLQAFSPHRTADPWDLAADVGGAILAVTLYRGLPIYRALLEVRIPFLPWRRPSARVVGNDSFP